MTAPTLAPVIGNVALDGPAVLAPMAGRTDRAFRGICRELGSALGCTELISAKTVLQESARTRRMLDIGPEERPVAVQLYGSDPFLLAQAAQQVEAQVAPDIIDLNMGCPVPKVVKRGEGAALMRRPKLIEAMVSAVVNAVKVPVTAKTRAGWDDASVNVLDVALAIEAGGASALTVHARTRSMGHSGAPMWQLLAQVREAVAIPLFGNGGIQTASDALAMKEQTGVDGVMIARGAVGNPWIFGQISRAWNKLPPENLGWTLRRATIVKHIEATVASFERAGLPQAHVRACRFLRGHLIHYARPLPGFPAFRLGLNDLETQADILAALDQAAS